MQKYTFPERDGRKIFGLDLMRIIALLMALGAHITWIYTNDNNILTKALDFGGFVAVEIFFVLSGFLISGSLYRLLSSEDYNLSAVWRFIKRRAFRIMPNYLFILLINLIVAWYFGRIVEHPWRYFIFFQNLAWSMPAFWPESWTMSIKEVTYFVLPFLLLFFSSLSVKISRKYIYLITIICFLLLFDLSKIINYMNGGPQTIAEWNVSLRSVYIFRADSVLLGMLCFWVSFHFQKFWNKAVIPAIFGGIILLGTAMYFVGVLKWTPKDSPLFWDVLLLPMISTAMALLLPWLSTWKFGPEIMDKPVKSLSAVSYSVYLIHYSFVLYLMKYIFDTTAMNNWQLHTFTLSYIVVTFALSYLLYLYFEKPLMKLRARKDL